MDSHTPFDHCNMYNIVAMQSVSGSMWARLQKKKIQTNLCSNDQRLPSKCFISEKLNWASIKTSFQEFYKMVKIDQVGFGIVLENWSNDLLEPWKLIGM